MHQPRCVQCPLVASFKFQLLGRRRRRRGIAHVPEERRRERERWKERWREGGRGRVREREEERE